MHIVLLKCPDVQIAFSKFTCSDNQAVCRVYSNCCCSCSFEAEIIKISQSSHKMYSNNILNFQECTTILNACTKKSGNLLKAPLCTYIPDDKRKKLRFSIQLTRIIHKDKIYMFVIVNELFYAVIIFDIFG